MRKIISFLPKILSMSLNLVINNKSTYQQCLKIKLKFSYTKIVDDITEVFLEGSKKYELLNFGNSLKLKTVLGDEKSNVKMYKLFVYVLFEGKIYRYEFTEETLSIAIDVLTGKTRPIIKVNNKSAIDYEEMITGRGCCAMSDNYAEEHLDYLVKNRNKSDDDSCVIS